MVCLQNTNCNDEHRQNDAEYVISTLAFTLIYEIYVWVKVAHS